MNVWKSYVWDSRIAVEHIMSIYVAPSGRIFRAAKASPR